MLRDSRPLFPKTATHQTQLPCQRQPKMRRARRATEGQRQTDRQTETDRQTDRRQTDPQHNKVECKSSRRPTHPHTDLTQSPTQTLTLTLTHTHTHTHSLSLSLSLSHTHTPQHTKGSDGSLAMSMPAAATAVRLSSLRMCVMKASVRCAQCGWVNVSE
jgi:hypothetical protein